MEDSRSIKNENQQIHNKVVFDTVNDIIQNVIRDNKPWMDEPVKKDLKLVEYVKEKVQSVLSSGQFATDNVAQIIEKEEKQQKTPFNYANEELAIKNLISDQIFESLLLDTVDSLNSILSKTKIKT